MDYVVEAQGISKDFRVRGGTVSAVADVSFSLSEGDSIGLVGESGSGKSTLGAMVGGLLQPSSGRLVIGEAEVDARRRAPRSVWRTTQMVFQDPYSSLNPRMRVVDFVAEPLKFWGGRTHTAAIPEAYSLLERVGLPAEVVDGFPKRLSGGQRQRASIARALAARPKLLICDESVSALDVSVQSQILQLLQEVRIDTGVALLFISHDIGVVRLIADRIMVMKRGQILETLAPIDLTPDRAGHAYTRELLSAVPSLGSLGRGEIG